MNVNLIDEISNEANSEGFENINIVFRNYTSSDPSMKSYEYQGETAFDRVTKTEA